MVLDSRLGLEDIEMKKAGFWVQVAAVFVGRQRKKEAISIPWVKGHNGGSIGGCRSRERGFLGSKNQLLINS